MLITKYNYMFIRNIINSLNIAYETTFSCTFRHYDGDDNVGIIGELHR